MKHYEKFLHFFDHDNQLVSLPSGRRGCGDFQFGTHLGKPLTEQLWNDLTVSLGVEIIRIVTHDGGEKLVGFMSFRGVSLYLDQNNCLKDIYLTMGLPPRQ